MYKVSVLRTVRRLFFALLMLSPAHLALAQPTSDPTSVEFAPSPDHAAVASDGTTAIVQEYLLSFYIVGQGSPLRTVTLDKPAPAADGKIRLDFTSLVTPFATPGVTYEARIMASGPGGVTASLASNQFGYSVVCGMSLTPGFLPIGAAGGNGSVAMTTAAGCAWSSTSNAGWLATTSGASGTGSGTVGFTVAPNTGQSARTGTLTIGGQTFTVNQAGTLCTYSSALTRLPLYAQVEPIGADTYVWDAATVDARAPQRALAGRVMSAWFAEDFSIAVNLTGAEPHQVALYMADYDGYGRSQKIDVLDANGVVLDTRTVSNFTGGHYLVWTVQGRVTFHLTKLEGNNAVVSAVLAGPAPAGSATGAATAATFVKTDTTTLGNWKGVYGADGFVVVADEISPSLAGVAGSGAIAVTAPGGCAWTMTSNAPWLTMPSGATGSGSATVGFSATANPDATQRAGTLTVGGQTLTLTQAASSCAYTIATTTQAVTAAAASGSVEVTSSTGCAWTAASSAPWLTVTSGASGSGAGTVAFGASANTGPTQRTATLTIGGRVFTVTQAGLPCTYTISATTQALTAAAATGSVAVTSLTGCAWTATSSATWLTVTSGASGSGAGSVAFGASANTGATQRTATLTIAGRVFTVTQAAPPCAFLVSPLTVTSILSAGGTSTVAVTTVTGCAWTAASNATWLTVTPGAGGTGTGSATFSASTNASTASRSGTITIAGQAVSVTQPGTAPCTIVLSPTTQSVNAKRSVGTIGVTTGAACPWTAQASAAWLTITSAVTTQGKVTYEVARNVTGASRTATITVGGVVSTITQRTDNTPNPVSGLRVVGG